MKQLFLLVLILSLTTANAQKRFYPSLSNLVQLEEQSSIPKELKYLKIWYDESVDNIYYKDFQFSGDPRNSATFKSLGLIFRHQNEFEFYKSGLIISFDTTMEEKVNPIIITNNHYWEGLNYGIDIQLDTYNPEGDFYRFLLLRRIESLSEEQAIANFINNFTEPNKGQEVLEKFIEDINERNKINIVYKDDMTLKDVSREIKSKMPKSNFYWAAYNTYIKTKEVASTRKNMSTFFKSLSAYDIEDSINETILPHGDIIFSDRNTMITLPEKYFKYATDFSKEPVSFYVSKIDYNLNYDYKNKNYDLSIKLYPKKDNGIKETYNFKHKYKDILDNNKEKVKRAEVKKEDMEYVELNFRPDSFSISIQTDIKTDDWRFLKLYKDFKTN